MALSTTASHGRFGHGRHGAVRQPLTLMQSLEHLGRIASFEFLEDALAQRGGRPALHASGNELATQSRALVGTGRQEQAQEQPGFHGQRLI